jgi:hypothetical protein
MAYIGNTPADKYQTLQKQSFTTSATDTYTLSYAVTNPQDLGLFINNVRQNPNDAYTVSGTTLTLSSAITSSDTMYAVFLGRAVETVAPAIGSVTNSMLANSSITLNGSAVSLGGSASVANTPSFQAYLGSAQTGISDSTEVKVNINTEVFDTDNAYDNSTNYRFTPQVAGKYFCYGQVAINGLNPSNMYQGITRIKKNGSTVLGQLWDYRTDGIGYTMSPSVSGIIEMNGSTDYIELYIYHVKGTTDTSQIQPGQDETRFMAFKLIGV